MKNFLIWTVLIWGIGFTVPYFCSIDVEAYGQTALKFDDERNVYFIETADFQSDVESLRDKKPLSVGMPVSFIKTSRCAVNVFSGALSKDELLKIIKRYQQTGGLIGAGAVWFFLIVGFIWETYTARKMLGTREN